MSEAAFDYVRAARDAGWRQLDGKRDLWIKPGSTNSYEGDVRGLCFYIGKGPEWDAWKLTQYAAPPS